MTPGFVIVFVTITGGNWHKSIIDTFSGVPVITAGTVGCKSAISMVENGDAIDTPVKVECGDGSDGGNHTP